MKTTLCTVFAVCVLMPVARGQTTFGTITGSVTDATGAAIPGVTVTATHTETNVPATVTSNEAGVYTIPQLKEGTYRVRARGSGFKEYVAQQVILQARDFRRLDIKMEVGAVETTVEVTAGVALIETETARISDSKGANQLKTLPLNTRSLWGYLGLTPNVVQAGGGSANRRFAGSRLNQSDAAIDGITISNSYDGTQISPLVSYIDSFQEMRVDMANNTAEYGAIGQVTIVSKSGTNELHGSAFDYYSTPWFRARNPFASQRGTGISHQPGYTIGGPVVIPGVYNGRNRTFFFHSFETNRGSAVLDLLNPTVPLASWRQGDFSSLLPGTVVRDPMNGNQPFAGNLIPANRINAVSQRIQDRFYPLPNFGDTSVFGSQNYREQKSRPRDPSTYYTIRGDHHLSERAFFFARWTWNRGYSRAYEGNLPTIGQRWQTRDTRALNLSYTHNLKPTLVNELRFGLAYNDNPRHGALMGKEVIGSLGVLGLADDLPDINGLLKVNFSGLGITGLTQTDWRHPGFKNYVHQLQEQLSWFRGRHSVKAGVLTTRTNFGDWAAPANLFGNVTFSNRFTGFPYADFLLGIPTTAARAFPNFQIDRTRWSYDFFVTDDFKVNQKLSLSLGLRYEWHPAYNESNGLNTVFDVGSGKIVVPDGALSKVSPLMPRGYVDVVEASTVGLPNTLLKTDRNNFAPRLGVAYRPWGNDTVIRAGYGIFYDIVARAVSAGGVPFAISEPNYTNQVGNPQVIFPYVYPSSGGQGPSTVSIPAAYRSDLRVPFSMQYNLTVEHQRWNTGFRMSYIGTNTRQGEWRYNINQPVGDNRLYVDKPRLFPQYPGIDYYTNGAGHQFNSLTFEIERQFARGLSYQFSYALARDIGDLERGEASEDAYNRDRERAVWLDIPTHRVTGNVIYELPLGRGKRFASNVNRWVNFAIGGWETSWIYSLNSGEFLTPLWTGPDPTGTRHTNNRTPANVTIRPNQLRDGNLPAGQRSVNNWFDAGAFGAPTPGAFGTSAKGVIKGPGVNVWHAGLFKNIPFTERARLRLEITATNFFNHPNYSNPNMDITDLGNVGVISGVGDISTLDSGDQRSFRAGVRLEW